MDNVIKIDIKLAFSGTLEDLRYFTEFDNILTEAKTKFIEEADNKTYEHFKSLICTAYYRLPRDFGFTTRTDGHTFYIEGFRNS